jgi:mannose-6-phosphate isomerase-like protein (cupin superfamily)
VKYQLDLARGSAARPDGVIVPASAFDDPRMEISAGVLAGGDATGRRVSSPRREEVWIVLDGGVETLGPGNGVHRSGPGVLAGFSGGRHGLANPGRDPIRYIRVAMGEDLADGVGPADNEPEWSPLDLGSLHATKAHGGTGHIRFRRLWDHDRFVTGWGFVDHAVVDPGTSVGYHRHDTVQECYLILNGNGVMKVDGTVFEVTPGTCAPNHLGGAHGIAASGEMVEFINVALYTDGRFDATDLGEDLSDCL